MALDLGELRAGVVIDQSQVPRGLAAVRRRWQDFTRGMTADARRSGADAGGAMGNGMGSSMPRGLAGVQRRLETFWGRLRSSGARAGEEAGDRTSRGLSSRLTGGLSRGVGGLGKIIGGAGSKLGIIAAGGAAALAGMAVAGVAALGAVGVAGAIVGVKVASGNEQAAISFETMLGSATKADRFLRELQKFAAETPFEFPELQTAASSLISAGIEADKVIPIMRTLGDVTSGMGTGSEGVKRATIALQQMSAAGRITGEDLNQLRDAGIPVYDLLSKATGKSKEEVVKLAQAGKLGKKELGQMMEALESGKGLERFSGLMEKQSHSLAGMWSTLKDTLGQGLAGIMSNALPLLKDGLNGITSVAAGFFGWFAKNQGSISRLFKTAGTTAGVFGRIIAAVFGSFTDSLGDGTSSVKNFADFIETHQSSMVSVFVTVADAALAFGIGMGRMAVVGLRALAWLDTGVGKVMVSIITALGRMTRSMADSFDWIPGLGPKLRTAADKFDEMADRVRNNDGVSKGATKMADSLENTLIPAAENSRKALKKVGEQEVTKAAQRDAAKKAAQAIRDIGDAADGSQIKLKKWADRSKLGADAQKGLRDRIKNAKDALHDQIAKMQDAGAGQGKLTKAWEKGKDRLYNEFKQMGLSNTAAKKLADRYAGIKPKVETKVTAPGLKSTSDDTATYVTRQKKVDGHMTTSVEVKWGSSGKVALKRGGKMTYVAAADGGILPGYTPGRDVHRFTSETGDVLDLSGGEPVLRPEAGKVLGRPWVDGINAAARSGGQGAVRRYLGQLAGGGTIPSFGKANHAGKTAHAAGVPVAEAAMVAVNNEAVALLKAAAAKAAAAAAAAGGGNGGYSGPVGGGASGIRRIANSFHPSYIAGHRDPQGGPAFDIGSSGQKNSNIANALRSNHGKLGLRYVISRMKIASARSGWRWRAYTPITGSGDFRHVGHVHVSYPTGGILPDFGRLHVGKYDTGGRLRPGWTMAYNGTNRDETIRTPEQDRQMAGRGPLVGSLTLQTSDRARDAVGELEYALHRIETGGPHA